MRVTYDENKRAVTLRERGLDFAESGQVFAGIVMTVEDDRHDYGEVRYQTIGRLGGQIGGLDAAGRRAPHHLDEEVQ